MYDLVLIGRFFLFFCIGQLDDDSTAYLEELNVSHNLRLVNIAMAVPYTTQEMLRWWTRSTRWRRAK